MCALTKKKLLKKKKANGFSGAFQASRRIFFTTPESYATRSMEKHWTGEDASHFKNRKKNDLIDISLNIAEDPEGGRRDFGGDCALERFVAVWGVHGKIGVALVHFSIYYCYPFSIFFFKNNFLCCARRRSRRVCAEFNSKSGDRWRKFFNSKPWSQGGGGSTGSTEMNEKKFQLIFFFLGVHLR